MSDVPVSFDDVEGFVSSHVEVELWVVVFLTDSRFAFLLHRSTLLGRIKQHDQD
jgi:hypothetical protein